MSHPRPISDTSSLMYHVYHLISHAQLYFPNYYLREGMWQTQFPSIPLHLPHTTISFHIPYSLDVQTAFSYLQVIYFQPFVFLPDYATGATTAATTVRPVRFHRQPVVDHRWIPRMTSITPQTTCSTTITRPWTMALPRCATFPMMWPTRNVT